MVTGLGVWAGYAWRLVWLAVLTAFFLALFIGSRFRFLPWIGGTSPRVLRRYLQTCGGGFVKLGQILSMRHDLLPEAYCLELHALLDQIPALPSRKIIRVIEEDLGRTLAECYTEFDEKALGTASLAQVHRARLHDGTEVAVKVLRPGVARRLRQDLWALRMIATLFDYTGVFLPTKLRPLIAENENLAIEELDLTREARNMDLLQQAMASDEIDHCSPRVYWAFCNRQTITMEMFRGVWGHQLITAVAENDFSSLEEWRLQGITPRRCARLLFRSIMEQCYRHRIFHADPHAGNLVFLPGGMLGYIDFGMVGWLDERQWSQQYRLFEEIAANRLHGAYEAMLDSIEPLTSRDLAPFERAFKVNLRDWMLAVRNPAASLRDKSTGRFLWRASLAMRNSGLRLPWTVMRLHRATVTSDVIELKLDPEIDLLGEMKKFFFEDACRAAAEPPDLMTSATGLLLQSRRVREFPLFFERASDFIINRMPHLARGYGETLTRFERSANLMLRYLRAGALLSAVALTVSLWWIPKWFAYEPSFNRPERVMASAALAGAALVLSKVINYYSEQG